MADILFEGPQRSLQRFADMGDNSHAQVVMTRDALQRAFFAGKEFRTVHEFSVADNATLVIKVVTTVNVILYAFGFELTTDSIKVSLKSGGTEGGTFSSALAIYRSNQMAGSPPHTTNVTMASGGTHTGGTTLDVLYIDSTNKNLVQTVTEDQPVGFAAGTYYIVIENIGNSTANGIFRARWEER